MKIINYKYGYIFDCSINGKIVVSQEEWGQIKDYLFNNDEWVNDKNYINFYKDMLKKDLTRAVETPQGKLYNIRVEATEGIVKKFDLKKYKRNNYMFLVTK